MSLNNEQQRHRPQILVRVADGSVAAANERQGLPSARADDGGDSQHGDASGCSVPWLPEDIWHHIHSLMPIRAAARAACISSAFLHSWRRRPNLALNRKTLEAEDSCGMSSVPYGEKIDSIMRNHSGTGLKILEIDFEFFDFGPSNFSYADRWVRIAVVPGIEELALTLYKGYNFPCSLLCDGVRNSIRHLELGSCAFHPTATLGPLRSLTSLHLRSVCITGDELECLLSSSLALEQLELIGCEKINFLKIPCVLKQLRCLIASSCRRLEVIESKAPNLSSIDTDGGPIKIPLPEALQMKELSMIDSNVIRYARTELPSFMQNLESLELFSTEEVCPKHLEQESVHGGSSDLRQLPEYRLGCLKSVDIVGFSSAKSLVELACCIVKSAFSLEDLVLDTLHGKARCSEENVNICWPISEAGRKESSRAVMAISCFRCLAKDHLVSDCRDPVRCTRCHASSHRSHRCKMKLCVLLRAAARRMRTPPSPKLGRAASAPPTSDMPPPALDALEPPTDFHAPSSAAFDPVNMIASSSSAPPTVEVLSLQSLQPLSLMPPEFGFVDKHVVESPHSPLLLPMGAAAPAAAGGDPSFRTATSHATPVGTARGGGGDSDFSGDEYASGELESASGGSDSDSSWLEGRPRHAEAWVSPGRPELADRLLFAFISPPVPMLEVSAFIRNALRSVAPLQPVDLLPSSMGAMLLRCESLEARDSLHLLGPIAFGGSELQLLKPEEAPNRFYRVPVWLAFVMIIGFPNEHWYEEKIRECFRGFAEVAEVDPECLTGENFGPLRVLLEVNDRLEIPREVRISCKQGVGRSGAVAQILPIRVWPREFQLDRRGNVSSFFGPPAPPAPGPSLGPMGPMSSMQQIRPSPHYYNLAYPPGNTPRYASNLQRGFDPLGSSAPSGSAPASALPSQLLAFAFIMAKVLHATRAAPSPVPPASPPNNTPASPPAAGQPPSGRAQEKPIITYQRRRVRSKLGVQKATVARRGVTRSGSGRLAQDAPASRRASSRLAAKAPASFIDMTTQAMQRKALLNSLSGCSLSLKQHVTKRNILARNRLPIGAAELRALVSAAELRALVSAAKLDTATVAAVVE